MILGGIVVYGFGAFFTPIIEEMGWTRAETSLAFSFRSIEGGITAPLIGLFVDKIGARKCIVAGVVIVSLAFLLISRMDSLTSFYLSFVCMTFGNSLAGGVAHYAVMAKWFRKRRTLAFGLLTAGYGASGIMAPILTTLIESFGWRTALQILSPSVLIIGLPLALNMRARPEPYGLLPDGEKLIGEVTNGGGNHAPLANSKEEGMSIKECLRTRTFWMLLLFTVLTGFASSSIQVHEMPHLINVGIPAMIASLTMTGITVTSLVGRLGFSWLGDQYSKKKLLVIAAALSGIGVFIFANIKEAWMIFPFLAFYAPGFGGPIPLLPSLQADYFGTKSFATIRGLSALGYSIPGVLGPWFAGWLFDLNRNYQLPFTIFTFTTFLAIPLIIMTPLKREGAGAKPVPVAVK
jgi:OFA family oxalate/formate antiporter-like MFS transporter